MFVLVNFLCFVASFCISKEENGPWNYDSGLKLGEIFFHKHGFMVRSITLPVTRYVSLVYNGIANNPDPPLLVPW